MRLVVAIPCYDTFARETALSLAMMCFRIGQQPPPGLEFLRITWMTTSNLPRARASLAEEAVQFHRATHILWIDSDMGFPQDSFHRLLAHDLEIVGCNYPKRLPPRTSTASDLDGKYFPPGRVGLEQAGIIGFGLLLMRASVFETEYELPLFAHHDEHSYCSDDFTFCRKVRAAGHEIWIDHDLSREVRHVGSVSFGIEDIEEGAG